jgi:hypothetical protein
MDGAGRFFIYQSICSEHWDHLLHCRAFEGRHHITIPRVISWLESENWEKHFCAEFTIRSRMGTYWFANTFNYFLYVCMIIR